MSGATPFWEVDDIHDTVAALTDASATIAENVRDVGGGKLIAILEDEDGNMIGLTQTPQELPSAAGARVRAVLVTRGGPPCRPGD
jgi:hypothetical protein